MLFSHACETLRKEHIGQTVTLCGWVRHRRDHGGLIFIDLYGQNGLAQIVFDPAIDVVAHAAADQLRSEWVISVTGKVRPRPEGQANLKMPTGEIEVEITKLDILSKAKTPPFELDIEHIANEEMRLKYRYLDLRRERLAKNMRLRHEVTRTVRDHFFDNGFLEVETPILIKGTPEGSREYIVPSRLHESEFYVLPQSPQQLKQLLMVASLPKYFQVARCFRDEDQRGDRQPEFTQVDVEMAFPTQESVMEVFESCFLKLSEKYCTDKSFPKVFPRITWIKAMSKYGSDKPDTRFGLEFVEISEAAKTSGFGIFERSERVFALHVPKNLGEVTRGMIDEWTKLAQKHGAGGLAWIRIGEESGPVAKNSTPVFLAALQEKTGAASGDLLFFGAGSFGKAVEPLGQVRLAVGDTFGLRDAKKFNYLWVTEFPMFERDEKTGGLSAVHHPFTRPMDEDLHLLDTKPEAARAVAYDLVLNGIELGGGSIRIHEPELQSKIFDLLSISKENAQARFGHLLEAFSFGTPPHGGMAFGLDRVVMLFAGEPNIREVIAFPKSQSAQDLMLGAPSPMPKETLDELSIALKPKPKA